MVGREGREHLHKHQAMDIKVKLGWSLYCYVIIAREGGTLGSAPSLVIIIEV